MILRILCYRLYNKDAIIEFLLDKSADKAPVEAALHIKSIKVNRLSLILKSIMKSKRCYKTSICLCSHYILKVLKIVNHNEKILGNVMAEKSLVNS